MLNAIVAINPEAVQEAKRDKKTNQNMTTNLRYSNTYKDNTNVEGMPTTAGTHCLLQQYRCRCLHHYPNKRQRSYHFRKTNPVNGLISFSSWAPMASAVGGQTLNPMDAKNLTPEVRAQEAAMAANYAAAAVGTETSGSILSPSWQNSLIGLKPTTFIIVVRVLFQSQVH
jgi:amidase